MTLIISIPTAITLPYGIAKTELSTAGSSTLESAHSVAFVTNDVDKTARALSTSETSSTVRCPKFVTTAASTVAGDRSSPSIPASTSIPFSLCSGQDTTTIQRTASLSGPAQSGRLSSVAAGGTISADRGSGMFRPTGFAASSGTAAPGTRIDAAWVGSTGTMPTSYLLSVTPTASPQAPLMSSAAQSSTSIAIWLIIAVLALPLF